MVNVNPLEERRGLIVLEDEVGHQQWALITESQIEVEEDLTSGITVSATLAPGETLKVARTLNPNEENVLVYTRLLLAVLREERDRYAALERRFGEQGVQLRRVREEAGSLAADRDADMHYAWTNGAVQGWIGRLQDRTPGEVLERNPHPAPDGDEDDEENNR